MTDNDIRAIADQRFAGRLEETGARDPREFYRERLRELRDRDEAAFHRAVDHFENHLIPAVAAEHSDPLAEWLEYGKLLSEMTISGETIQIDPSGAAKPYSRPVPADCLVLHLPTSTREKALAVGIPAELSTAQRAAYELLVKQSTG